MSLVTRILTPAAITALLALATSACGAPSIACYGISDAEAVQKAQRVLANEGDSWNVEGMPIESLVATGIQSNRYERGQDGAVSVLFTQPDSGKPGGIYLEIFEDCDLEWRMARDTRGNAYGPWRKLAPAD